MVQKHFSTKKFNIKKIFLSVKNVGSRKELGPTKLCAKKQEECSLEQCQQESCDLFTLLCITKSYSVFDNVGQLPPGQMLPWKLSVD